jgi:alanine dehydrogenase
LLILSEADIAKLLSIGDAVDAVDGALRAQASDAARFPLRNIVFAQDGLLGAMPGYIGSGAVEYIRPSTTSSARSVLGAKLVSVFPGNAERDLHTHHALIALFDAANGEPRALMDGRYITEIRTAAVSAVATRALARPHASVAAILGTGVQARAHAHALRLVMRMDELRVWGRERRRADALVRDLREAGIAARACDSAETACEDADVICTVTASSEPVVTDGAVRRGAHLNAVGACTPRAREIPAELMARATLFADSLDGALTEAGDIVLAVADGVLQAPPMLTLLADVVAGRAPGRTSDDDITLFESLGIAIEDIACAALVYERAQARGIGTQADL